LIVMVIEGLVVLLEEVEEMIKRDPQMVPVAMSLIPTALMGMLDYIQAEQDAMDDGAA